jgi:hypothetical protein
VDAPLGEWIKGWDWDIEKMEKVREPSDTPGQRLKVAIRRAATRRPDKEGKIHSVREAAKIGTRRECSHFGLSDDDHVWWPQARKKVPYLKRKIMIREIIIPMVFKCNNIVGGRWEFGIFYLS